MVMTIDEKRLAEIRREIEGYAGIRNVDARDLLAMLDATREDMRAIIAASYPAQPDATPTTRELCEHIGALHDAAARVDAHAAGERCVVCGHTLEEHDRNGWTCDCVRCPWSGESWKARALAAEKRAEANDAERRLTTFLEEKFVHVTALDEMRERAEAAERKIAALREATVSLFKTFNLEADAAAESERRAREVRAEELRRMVDETYGVRCPLHGLQLRDARVWLYDEIGRIERGEA